ncbi:MAG TPA: glycosyltransferase family 39 protein [Crinalium sp.]
MTISTARLQRTSANLLRDRLVVLLVIVLVIGIAFRFVNLDTKVYWHDETRTSLRIAGYRVSDLTGQLFNGHEISPLEFKRFQHINPDRNILHTFISLGANDPKHPPLYYGLLRIWTQFVGDAIAQVRALSAVLSLFAFPCLYWLCRELFRSHRVAQVGCLLLAVSPFQVLYAQEAREYALWTVTILLSSAVFLRAIRLQTRQSWLWYGATVALSLYSFTLSVLVILVHGVYLLGTGIYWRNTPSSERLSERSSERLTDRAIGFRLPAIWKNYWLAVGAGCLAFVPWAILIVLRFDQLRGNTRQLFDEKEYTSLVYDWFFGISSLFFDPNGAIFTGKLTQHSLWDYVMRLPVIVLIVYSLYFLCKTTSKSIWLLPLSLIGVQVITMMIPDLLFKIQMSEVPRYLIPLYLGIHLAVSYMFASVIFNHHRTLQTWWRLIFVVLISAGIFSCFVSSQATSWWNKGSSFYHPAIATIINQTERPLLISNSRGTNSGNLVSLSYLLNPTSRLLLVTDAELPAIPTGYSDIFVYNPNTALRHVLQPQYESVPVHEPGKLWKLVPKQT